MEDPDYKTLVGLFNQNIIAADSGFDKKNLKRSEPAGLIFGCSCEICESEAKSRFNKKLGCRVLQKSDLKKSRGFTWFLEKIGIISCEVYLKLNIPDVAVFKKGRAAFFLQHQRDRTIKYVTTSERLNNQEIIKTLTNIVRIRKKEEFIYKTGKIRSSNAGVEYGKETACLRYMSRHRDNDLEDVFNDDEMGALKVMNENEFTGLMWQRSGSTIWKTICYIQSTLKCKKGIGESFVHSYSFVDVDPTEIIKAGNEENEETEEILFVENRNKYCEYIFKKIYYLFEKYLKIIILHIKGEFLKDDNNRIWLIHASNIIAEDAPAEEDTEVKEIKPIKVHYEGDFLLSHLAFVAKQPKNWRIEKFSNIMNNECDRIIQNSKILDIFKPSEPDIQTTKAFEKLRKFTPYKLEDLLDNKKVKKLLKVYTSDKKNHRKTNSAAVKNIEYLTKPPSPKTESPKKQNCWVFTPKIQKINSRTMTRPSSSKPRSSLSCYLGL